MIFFRCMKQSISFVLPVILAWTWLRLLIVKYRLYSLSNWIQFIKDSSYNSLLVNACACYTTLKSLNHPRCCFECCQVVKVSFLLVATLLQLKKTNTCFFLLFFSLWVVLKQRWSSTFPHHIDRRVRALYSTYTYVRVYSIRICLRVLIVN